MEELVSLIGQQIPRLRRYARALAGERADADDLVQDTIERALRKLHLWRRGSDLRAWLFTIMHNVHVNQVRGRADGFRNPVEIGAADLTVRPTQSDLIEVMDIDAALRRLPQEQREVLLLIGLEQLSYQEAAGVLGIPIGTVMSRLSRGRERLRALLAGRDAPPAALKVIK